MAELPFFAPFTLAFRNMRTRLGRTLLTLTGIVLGVAVVLAIQVTNRSTLDSIRRVFDRAAGRASLLVVPASQGGDELDQDLMDEIAHAPGVVNAAPLVQVPTLLANEAGSWQIAFTINGLASGNVLQLYGIDPEIDPLVRVYALTAGRMPEHGRYETVLPARYAAQKNLNLGDELVVISPQGEGRMEIVGLLAEEGVALLNDGAVAFAPLDVVQDLFLRGVELDEIALQVQTEISEDIYQLQATRQRLADEVGRGGRVIYPAARG